MVQLCNLKKKELSVILVHMVWAGLVQMFHFSPVDPKVFTVPFHSIGLTSSIFSVTRKAIRSFYYVILLTRRTIRPYKMTELPFSLTEKIDEVNKVD
ncbi:hypothetical protein HanIR_Chr11g0530841 [Helianthus annuus]|nr:hypothetical protein HanIR_Chr11g0530841 [Helianthus annuus]